MNPPSRQQFEQPRYQQPQFDPQLQPQPRQQNGFDPNVVAAKGPARGELVFEAISQEEAPRAGAPRPRIGPPTEPTKPQFLEAPGSQTGQPAKAEMANTESESFFRTISREKDSNRGEVTDSSPAFRGLCVVSAVEDRELAQGIARHQISYRGHTLYFASLEKKEQFQASPGTFWPMLDGACAIALLEDEKFVEGSLEFAAVFRKRIWLFSSQKAMDEFLSDPADVAEEAIELAADLRR